jgi:sec-independent protein translocase protein TatA
MFIEGRRVGVRTLRPCLRNQFLQAEGFMFEGLFQPMHLLVIFGIALLVFGPRKLPELGKGLGDGIRGFRAAMRDQDIASEGKRTDINK